ncbi:ADP-ribose pyrophosphatase [Alkalihalophilus pseudofirmus]|uniref:NUDIX domain-containing protein n=1 Tax=Alkalihalobacterium alkalinitrilicum TaxID=427920 RepID=UPI00094CC86D|nr:NUDIX hydrolase [Alkalihalobacterium alkalinitrilicum]OLO42683.1 ADP-ribose pyrophosphatase [Alkalihalophilus pseudofirmus]
MSKQFYEKTLKSETLYEGRIIDLVLEDVELPNGKMSKREIVKHPGAVAIIPVTVEGKLVLIRQFRKALERNIVEIPAGKLEVGEKPEVCAMRELEEETGYKTNHMEKVISFYTSPGFADEFVHIYFTNQLEQGVVNPDEDEFVEKLEVTVEEAEKMILTNEIFDAKTAYAVQWLKLRNQNR